MALSHRERLILEQIEAQVSREDPDLAARLAGRRKTRRHQRDRLVWGAIATLLLVGGAVLALFGAAVAAPSVAAIGVALALIGFWCAATLFRRSHRPGHRT